MKDSDIEWTDHTFNPWIGCTKVSPGCANCYAETLMDKRYGRVKWGKGQPRQRTSAAYWKQPLKWNREAASHNELHLERFYAEQDAYDGASFYKLPRPRVFCASLADWLDEEVPIEWLADLLDLIGRTPNLDWLLLTKRPENWYERVSAALNCYELSSNLGESFFWVESWLDCVDMPERGDIPENIWIGTSIEDQPRDERISHILKIPAKVRFLSVEPMLGPIDFKYRCFNGADSFGSMPGIHWVIFGGESGPNARPCNPAWIFDGVVQCRQAGVAVFVKQLGAVPEGLMEHDGRLLPARMVLRDRKGGDMAEWPEELRVREFPNQTPTAKE